MPTSSDTIRRIAAEAKEHPERARLGPLAYDVLVRQAEGRALFAAREVVEARAEQHGVSRQSAESPSGNVLAILERGATSDVEQKLVVAFAVLGFRALATTAKDPDSVAERFVRAADWLELATPFVVHPFVDLLLDESTVARVHRVLGDAVLADQDGSAGSRARNAVRLSALAASTAPSAAAERARIAPHLVDPAVREQLFALAPDEALASAPGPRVAGPLGPVPKGGLTGFLRLATGWALLQWIGRGLGWLVGMRRVGEVALVGGGLSVVRRLELFGRTLRTREETWTRSSLVAAGRSVRYPALPALVGAVALALGILAGSFLATEAVASGETLLLWVGAALLLGGAAFDLGLSVLLPARHGRVGVELAGEGGRALHLRSVPADEADAFLSALAHPGRGARPLRDPRDPA
ncbi:MAG: hypothetical protein U0230_05705 [Polyangiales bacterium]